MSCAWSRRSRPASVNEDEVIRVDLDAEHDRYHRQELISWWDQARLRDARVLVVGAGALGNEIVKNLVLIGVGHIFVVDLDRIENSNLARCMFFRASDEGAYKAEVLAHRAAELNEDVEIVPLVGDVRLVAGLGLFADMDVALGGLDNREARLFVNQACWKTTTPWVDGAIEGLMGVVRVFVPPASACYECTLNDKDYELLAARRTCALLSRDDMLGGKVPTTATSSSVVAGMQVQEAIKLLHRDTLGEPSLSGAGYQFVGLTHESYVVQYPRQEECLSHDTYDLAGAECVAEQPLFGSLVSRAEELLGPGAVLDLEHEVVLGATCGSCGETKRIREPVYALRTGAGICPVCRNQWQLSFLHSIGSEDNELLELTPADLGLPPADVIVGRLGFERVFFILVGARRASELVAARALKEVA
jgi:molybdopterin/thiamine biosynthesis adenylyltransferase